ncbi:MAG: peptidoglycan bridge formation glycyltransferase FemA/FemB family protein [Chloroflexi bacterium]|nr:peptidoglycan bridge formation glycyltransferase FemA/FemB family protein [Chloroflexota bacterium]
MNMFELGEQAYSEADKEWDAFVLAHPRGSLLQTAVWARLKSRFGWVPQRIWVKKEGRIVAGSLMLIKSYAWGLVRIGYLPHGPLVDWDDEEQVTVLLNQIDLAAHKNRVSMVKMEPLVWRDEMPEWPALAERHGCILPTDTIQPPRTMLVDLRLSLDDILASMKQKTRYNIRLSAKKEVVVRQGTRDDLPAFVRLMQSTGSRNEFGVHVPKYYEVVYDQFNTYQPGSVALFLAEFEGRPLAAVMVFAWGQQASYLYGASGDEERQRMPTYAVQWAAVQWAKEKGCTYYDLWGVPDAEPEQLEAEFENREDGLWGVYRFKRGFNGAIRRTVGAADRVYNNLTYRLYKWRRGSEM